MSGHAARRLAYGLAGATVLLTVVGLAGGAAGIGGVGLGVGLAVIAVTYGVSGAVLASRRPGNPIGWIMAAIGLSESTLVIGAGYVVFTHDHWRSAPFAEIAAWSGNWIWIPGLGAILTFLLLLFPDGHPPSPRWRWVMWAAGIGMVLGTIGSAIGLWSARWIIFADPSNNDATPSGIAGAVGLIGQTLLFGVAGIASIASVVVRWRRAVGDERQQLRWFLLAAAVATVGFLVALPSSSFVPLLVAGMLLLPVAIAVAVMKYRLYELDVVIRKAVIVLLIGVGLTALSLLVLAWPLVALGGFSQEAKWLFLVGLAVGTLFGPLRRFARRVADRVVYGQRATPYEVLADFSERLGSTYSDEDVAARMAQLLLDATGADAAHVWLAVAGDLRPVASAPNGAPQPAWPVGGHEVHYRGERLGGLSVEMPQNDPLDATRERLIRDLAAQAGPVLANVRLIEDLRASRRRIVAAQDERAKKLERNIHDGAQQQLVALQVKLRLAGDQARKEGATATADLLESIGADAQGALENLRDLARGIYPPLLADQGLAAALEAQARKAAVPTTVEAEALGRFGQDVEAAVYFSCLEALQNVAKYAGATHATIKLSNGDGRLTFTVSDDGTGFDSSSVRYGTGLQGIADRLAALGGTLDVLSGSGSGTSLTGRLPAVAEGPTP